MTDQPEIDQLEKSRTPLDQTMFSEEGPLFSSETPDPAKQKRRKKVLLLLGGGLILVVGVIMALSSLSKMPQKNPFISAETPTPTPVNVAELGPLDRLFYEMSQDLDVADPTDSLLPLPPVAARILISSEK